MKRGRNGGFRPITTLDARDATAPPVFEVTAPKDAPNVVVIMLDDLGFGGTSAFGGVIQTPHFDKLASQGLMYNQFHTTALCSPNRQALKTGRNHHSVNQAKITEIATCFPGATGMQPDDVAPPTEPCCDSTATRPPLSASDTKLRCGRSAPPRP